MEIVPKLSVVVCSYNRVLLLEHALQSLAEQTADSTDYEVLIIDNNSTDSTQELAQRFTGQWANFRLFREGEQGLSHARNRGWQEARGRYVAYMDDDAKASPDWSERIIQAFEVVDPEPAAVGGKILPWYESNPPLWFSDEFEIRSWGEHAEFLSGENGKNGFSGSNMVFSRTLLESMGGFSPDFGMQGEKLRMGEETELFRRIWRQNPHFWYDPDLCVQHYVPAKNMKISYRIRRRFSNGLAVGRMEPSASSLRVRIKRLMDFFYVALVRAPRNIAKAGHGRPVKIVKSLEELAYALGKFFSPGG